MWHTDNFHDHNFISTVVDSAEYIEYNYSMQWCKLGGANAALAPPHLKCCGAKVCFCTTRILLKYII